MSSANRANSKEMIVIIGPTASGKSRLASEIARAMGGEIVSCDSVGVYKGFDIGSAKPTAAERGTIAHHMIDIVQPHEDYNAARYATEAREVIAGIKARGKLPIVVGGTGLYLRALWGVNWHETLPKDEGLRAKLEAYSNGELYENLAKIDPQRASEIHINDRFRLTRALELVTILGGPVTRLTDEQREGDVHSSYIIKLESQKSWLLERINQRTRAMLEAGLVAEVEGLLAQGYPKSLKPFQSIGYKEVIAMIEGKIPPDGLAHAISIATRQYAKRQRTLFAKIVPDKILGHKIDIDALLDEVRGVFG